MTKTWGKYVWFFFHSLAEHIDDEFYKKNSRFICNIIKNICVNLPCPECSIHAKEYTKTLTPATVPNKDALKLYFFTFHNTVNKRLRKPKFTDFDLYKRAKLADVFNQFKKMYSKTRNPSGGFHDKLHRKRIVNEMETFLMNNSAHFTWL
jgi:hypothetical protein